MAVGGQRTGAEFRLVQHSSSELEGGTQLGSGGREWGAGLEVWGAAEMDPPSEGKCVLAFGSTGLGGQGWVDVAKVLKII